jgi:hypothetical protein
VGFSGNTSYFFIKILIVRSEQLNITLRLFADQTMTFRFQTGPICYLRFFRQRVVVISDARVAQRLCVHQADKFTERPPGLFLARVLKNKGKLYCALGYSKKNGYIFIILDGFRFSRNRVQ